jgi:hypothetical protein
MNTFASSDRGRADAANAAIRSTTLVQRMMPSAALFLVAPLVAEFLLGNMSITHLGLLPILAPLYGGGAILIREFVRRTQRGWPSIFVLALAYGVLEEAFLMQSLFNPKFLGQNLHLLDDAYLPALGIGAWYTIFVLTLHTVWSISVPIAFVEPLVSYEKVIKFIRTTSTKTGLLVNAYLDRAHYPTGIKADPEQISALRLKHGKILPKWNYTISPNQ